MIKKKILLDTDIGSDIDDAVCLSYLLANPECELVGITTVSGQPLERAKLASALCIAGGKPDIPIYPGSSEPLLINSVQPVCNHAPSLKELPHKTEFPMHRHIQFMIDTIRANPGEITLLAIGPLTNVALLFKADPEIPSLLKELVLMCGVFGRTGAAATEWNSLCDPHASAIVYKAPVKIHRSIGLDVTLKVTMDKEEVRKRFNKGALPAVLKMAECFFEQTGRTMTFHDPLAAVTVFNDDVCTFVKGDARVETVSDYFKGGIKFDYKENGAHEVAWTVDPQKFFDAYFSVYD